MCSSPTPSENASINHGWSKRLSGALPPSSTGAVGVSASSALIDGSVSLVLMVDGDDTTEPACDRGDPAADGGSVLTAARRSRALT